MTMTTRNHFSAEPAVGSSSTPTTQERRNVTTQSATSKSNGGLPRVCSTARCSTRARPLLAVDCIDGSLNFFMALTCPRARSATRHRLIIETEELARKIPKRHRHGPPRLPCERGFCPVCRWYPCITGRCTNGLWGRPVTGDERRAAVLLPDALMGERIVLRPYTIADAPAVFEAVDQSRA